MDDMIDPLGDRVMKNVPPISRYPLPRDKLWHISSKNIEQFNLAIQIQDNVA